MAEIKREPRVSGMAHRIRYSEGRLVAQSRAGLPPTHVGQNASQKNLHSNDLRSRLKRTYSRDEIFEIWEDQDNIRWQNELEERRRRAVRAKVRKQKIVNLTIRSKRKIGGAVALFRKLSFRAKLIYTGVGIAALALILLLFVPVKQSGQVQQTDTSAVASATTQSSEQLQTDAQKQAVSATLPAEDPDFALLYPNGDESSYRQTVRRISPSDRAPVYVIVDELGGIKINVSQQELPESFKSDIAGSTKKMAQDFQAANILKTDDTDVYHGWSARDGVHSIILVKEKLLLLVRAERQLSDAQIVDYVSSLK